MTDFVVAECGIRQLHARCADAVWRKDYDAFGECYVEDGEWRVAGRAVRGRAEIAANLKRIVLNMRRVLMTFRTPILEVGNGTAVGRTYVTEQASMMNGQSATTMGTYYERFVQQGDQWRFAWRLFHLHYIGPPDLTGPFFENPDFGPPPAMPPLDALPVDHTGLLAQKNSAESRSSS